MKFDAKLASLLLAAGTVIAQDGGSFDDVEPNFKWSGSGKIHLVEGYATWRAHCVTPVSGVPVGCLNENGNLVMDKGDNCAVFYVPGSPGDALNTKKENFSCGYVDYFNCVAGDPGLDTLYTWTHPPPTYISGYIPSEESTTLFTWFVDHTPKNSTEEIQMELRLPQNPNEPPMTLPPGAPTFGVVMQWIPQ
ncbi:hypothetical protein F4782DRAFT_534780 [Xylaria castorea]|nr:hypothetical protein F4782DRAFT_534780 [Xylaria castorea]